MNTWQNKLELFADNTQIVKKNFFWQYDLLKHLAALLYAQEGKAVDCDAIKQCHALIKQNTKVFSQFRGNMALLLSTMLALSPNPQEILNETLKVYGLLKGVKFHDSDYLVIAAYRIAAQSDGSDYENAVTRIRSFYDEMKARHFFLTGQEDYVFAAMLALTDLDVAAGTERVERIFTRLKGEFGNNTGVQTLAQMLTLNSDDSVTERVLALRDAFRARKIKSDTTYIMLVLGFLALLPVEIDAIVSDVSAAQDALRAKKGFGSLSVGTEELLLLGGSIVAGDYADSVKDGLFTATLLSAITNLIFAQDSAADLLFITSLASQ